jgi:hypothetical protein
MVTSGGGIALSAKLRLALLVVLSVCVLSLVVACDNDERATAMGDQEVLQVDDIRLNPGAFQRDTLVTGTVTTFSERDGVSLIGVVDNEHILMCRNLDCLGSKIYAVNVSGQELPNPGDVVTMIGSFRNTGSFWLFSISDYAVNDNIIDLLQ